MDSATIALAIILIGLLLIGMISVFVLVCTGGGGRIKATVTSVTLV